MFVRANFSAVNVIPFVTQTTLHKTLSLLPISVLHILRGKFCKDVLKDVLVPQKASTLKCRLTMKV